MIVSVVCEWRISLAHGRDLIEGLVVSVQKLDLKHCWIPTEASCGKQRPVFL